MVFRIPRDVDPYFEGPLPGPRDEPTFGVQPSTGPVLIPPTNPNDEYDPGIPPPDVRGPRPIPPSGFTRVDDPTNEEPAPPSGGTEIGGGSGSGSLPPTAFNPPRFNAGGSNTFNAPPNNQVQPQPPFSTQPPSGRLPTGSYRSYRPNLKVRNDAYLRGFGNELGANPSPAFSNPDDVGYGGLRIGGYRDPSNPLLNEEQKRRRQGSGGQYSGAFGLGLGS